MAESYHKQVSQDPGKQTAHSTLVICTGEPTYKDSLWGGNRRWETTWQNSLERGGHLRYDHLHNEEAARKDMITEMEWHPQHDLQNSDWYGEYLCVYVKHSMSKPVGAQNYPENVPPNCSRHSLLGSGILGSSDFLLCTFPHHPVPYKEHVFLFFKSIQLHIKKLQKRYGFPLHTVHIFGKSCFWWIFVFWIISFTGEHCNSWEVLVINPRPSWMTGKCSIPELFIQPKKTLTKTESFECRSSHAFPRVSTRATSPRVHRLEVDMGDRTVCVLE